MTQAGAYTLLDVLGRGGFGTVYRARFHGSGGLERDVAIKLLDPGLPGHPDAVRRLRDEARLVARVHHRAVVKVEQLVDLEGSWAIVMELVPGRALDAVLADGPMPQGPALELVREIAGALHAAWHTPGPAGAPLKLLHRDIKPANIRLTPSGEVRLLDFGIARADPAARETRTTSLVYGTPDYMAPERFDGEALPESDVYGLGCVLFELLTGEMVGRTSARADRHTEVWSTALGRVSATGVDGEVVGLLSEMLAHSADDRPSAREVRDRCASLLLRPGRDDLTRWAEGRDLSAAPPAEAPLEGPRFAAATFSLDEATDAEEPVTPAVPAPAPGAQAQARPAWFPWVGGAALAALGLSYGVVADISGGAPDPGVGTVQIVEEASTPPRADPPSEAARPVEAAEPEPTPPAAPPPPAAAPEPRPTPGAQPSRSQATVEPARGADEPLHATVETTGGGTRVTLSAGGVSHPVPGPVPPGTWTIGATFDGQRSANCGQATVAAGERLTIATDPVFTDCVVVR